MQKTIKTNPKFGLYEFSSLMIKYLEHIDNPYLLRYGLSIFPSDFVFGEKSKEILNQIYNKSLKKMELSPNSMHKYGAENVITDEQLNLIKSNMLPYIYEVFGIDLTKKCKLYTNFSVHYGKDFDKELKEHVDDSDITINICLKNNLNLTGLQFNSTPDTLFSCKHNKMIQIDIKEGDILIHSGKQPHEVIKQNIIDGERVNLILWLKFI